jgi:hypothetical protein
MVNEAVTSSTPDGWGKHDWDVRRNRVSILINVLLQPQKLV